MSEAIQQMKVHIEDAAGIAYQQSISPEISRELKLMLERCKHSLDDILGFEVPEIEKATPIKPKNSQLVVILKVIVYSR